MMEDRQMLQYKFFQRIGAFSVNLKESKSLITSLRYAVYSMERPGASLFIYPEGEIVPFSTDKPAFKKGLAWITERCPNVDIVPIGIYIQSSKFDKPELFILIGAPLNRNITDNIEQMTEYFEAALQEALISLQNMAHSDRHTLQNL